MILFDNGTKVTENIVQDVQRVASMGHVTGATELSIYPVWEHYLVYLPISNKRIVIVALIRQTRDVPTILNANGSMIQRQLKEIFEKLEQGTIPNLIK